MRFILLSVLCFWAIRVAGAAESMPGIGDLALAECYGQTKLVQVAEVSGDGKRAHVQFFAPGDTANCGMVFERDELIRYRSVASVEKSQWFGFVKSSFHLGEKVVLKNDDKALGTIVDLDDSGFAQIRFENHSLDAKMGQMRFAYIAVEDLAHF